MVRDLIVFTTVAAVVLATTAASYAPPVQAAPQINCSMVRQYVQQYGLDAVKRLARDRGIADSVINYWARRCLGAA